MHHASRLKFECFVDAYIGKSGDLASKSVLDVGSRQVDDTAYSYRHALDPMGIRYTGLDLEAGFNVDIVPANAFVWDELAGESFDFVISGQAFEHNPFMWITMAEIARVLKPGGIAFIIAPSAGGVHRFPFDCWRYYPDSWAALAAVTQLQLVESIREPGRIAKTIKGGQWMDAAGIFMKPEHPPGTARDDFYANLALIVAPFKARRFDVTPAVVNEGPCFKRYMEAVDVPVAAEKMRGPQRRLTPAQRAARAKAKAAR